MNIVYATPFFSNTYDEPLTGMPGYVYKIARIMMSRGHDVRIVAGAMDGRTWRYKGIDVYNCRWDGKIDAKSPFVISRAILARELSIQRKLKEINVEKKIDIVQYAGWSGTGFLHHLKCPCVLRLSTYSKVQYKDNESWHDIVEIYSFWERISGKRADGIISPSVLIGKQFENDVSKKVSIIETPIDSEVMLDDKFYLNHLYGIKYFLFAGVATKDKGFEVIRKAVKKFFEQNQDLYFVFCGWDKYTEKGSAVKMLQNELGANGRRFIYAGAIERNQLFSIMNHAQFVLMPSLVDNFPNTCLEAMSMNKIVIGTYGSSLEEVINDKVNGILTMPGNHESLLEAMIYLANLSADKVQIMENNVKKSIRRFEAGVVAEKLENYYSEIIGRKPRNQ